MENNKIIAVDFDGTLCFGTWPDVGEPNIPLIEQLKALKNEGNKLILWTCRAGEALDLAVSWCRDQQLEFDAVNDNYALIIGSHACGWIPAGQEVGAKRHVGI